MSTEKEPNKDEDMNNIDHILKLMEIHTKYIISLDSPILWIRNIYVVATLAILSKIYLNQIDPGAPCIEVGHGMITILLLTLVCYLHEGIFNFWQAAHLNRMSKLDEIARKSLLGEKENILTETYEYKKKVHEATKKDHNNKKVLKHVKWILNPQQRLSPFFFYLLIGIAGSFLAFLITRLVDCW